MKKIIIIFSGWFIVTLPFCINAQQNIYSKVIYDEAKSGIQAKAIKSTNDSGYVIVGTALNLAFKKGLVIKIDKSGNIKWNRTFSLNEPNTLKDLIINDITECNDSGFVFVGSLANQYAGGFDALCAKISSNGDTLWIKKIMATGVNNTYALSVQQTIDSGYVLSGYVSLQEKPTNRIFVAKLDQAGNLQWANQFSGDDYDNYCKTVKQTPDSGYLVGGYMADYPPYYSYAFLIKLLPDGTISWSKKYDLVFDPSGGGNDVIITKSGIIYYMYRSIMKTDFSGNILWSKQFYLRGVYYDKYNPVPKLHYTSDGDFIFISNSDEFYSMESTMTKIDSLGNIKWINNLGLIGIDVAVSSDKGFLATGNGPIQLPKSTQVGIGSPHIGIYKMDSLGNTESCAYKDYDSSRSATIFSSTEIFVPRSGAEEERIQLNVDSIQLIASNECVGAGGAAIKETEQADYVKIYPNPTDGHFKVQFNVPQNHKIQLELYDNTGRRLIIKELNTGENNMQINCTDLENGVYLCKLLSDGKLSWTDKVIILK